MRTFDIAKQRPGWLRLVLPAVLSLLVEPASAQIFSGTQQQTPTAGGASRGANYFMIMGHITRPNTYELPTASPSLVNFVQFAGDLKSSASGQIRIIRGNRVGQTCFYTPKSTLTLIPGDIVVVDGRLGQGRILRGGQSNATPDGGMVSIGLSGIRPYPILLTIPAERATIRWITRHLGLDPGIASSVKAIMQRQTEQASLDTRLSTGTVLLFDASLIDASRLPDDLPVPVKAGRPGQQVARQQKPTPARNGIQPLPGAATGNPRGQYGAAPGYSRVPRTPDTVTAQPAESEEHLALSPAEENFVKDLLTDPASKPLDQAVSEPEGRAFVPSPGVASTAQRKPTRAASPQASPVDSSYQPDNGQEFHNEGSNAPVPPVPSPEALRPFQSTFTPPQELEPFGSSTSSSDAQSESALSSIKSGTPNDGPSLSPVPEIHSTDRSTDDTQSSAPVNESQNFSLALQGAGLAATAASARPGAAGSNTATNGNSSPPSPPPATGGSSNPIGPSGPLQPVPAVGAIPAYDSSPLSASASGKSQLLPPPPDDTNWAVVSISLIGALGAAAAAFLIFSIASENPEPRPTPINKTDRYWLDRIIENELPVVDEKVAFPNNTQLFGKPAPIQRIDAAHREIPRPHFSARGGQSGVLKANPAAPAAPSPDTPDSDPGSDTMAPKLQGQSQVQRTAASGRKSPAAPLTPAAELEPTQTAVFGDTADNISTDSAGDDTVEIMTTESGRQFRFDKGHRSNSTSREDQPHTTDKPQTTEQLTRQTRRPKLLRESGSRRGSETVAVKPSPSVTEGSNLLDRVLSSVDRDKNAKQGLAQDRGSSDVSQSDAQ